MTIAEARSRWHAFDQTAWELPRQTRINGLHRYLLGMGCLISKGLRIGVPARGLKIDHGAKGELRNPAGLLSVSREKEAPQRLR